MAELSKIEEIKIIASLKKGNSLAFNQLFEEYGKRLYFFAYKLLKSEEDAEEVVQDVFLKVWDKRRELKLDLSFKSYLFTIASNCIKKQFIRKDKEDSYKHSIADEYIKANQADNDQLDYKLLLDRIDKLVDAMPARRKEIFLKRKKEDIPVKQIAAELNISEKTVENQLTIALNFLRNDLKKAGLSGLLFFCLFFE